MKAPLTDANIRLICFIFGVNEEWLREGTGEMMDEDAQLSEKSKRMLSIFESVSDAAQDLLIEYAEKLIDMEASLGEEASHRGHKNISRR
jgi:hypothetical protein